MKAVSLILFSLLFLLVFTIPTFAVESLDINTTIAIYPQPVYGIDVTNVSGTPYVYVVGGCHQADWCVYRFNATFGDKKYCEFYHAPFNWPNRLFAVINSTHAIAIDSSGTGWYINITAIGTSTECGSSFVTIFSQWHSGFGGTDPNWHHNVGTYYPSGYDGNYSWIYAGSNGAQQSYIFNSSNTTGLLLPTVQANWSTDVFNTPLYSIRLPDETNNETMYGIDTNQYLWNTYNQSHVYGIANGIITTEYQNPFIVYGITPPGDGYYYNIDFFKQDVNTTWGYATWNDGTATRAYRFNWSLVDNSTYYSSCDWTNEPIGTTCSNDSSHRTYVTNLDNCALTYGACPSGSVCVNETPQYNATYSLDTNIADCNGCYFVQIYNSSHLWQTVKSNCWNTQECASQGTAVSTGEIVGWYRMVWSNGVYHYNQTIPDGVTVNITKYTTKCMNSSSGATLYIVNEFGNQVTESQFLYDETGIDINNKKDTCPNTATTCYDSGCNVIPCYVGEDSTQTLKSGINSMMGSPFGADIISLFVSAVISILVFMETKDRNINLLLGVFLLCASIFSFIGLLVWWFIVLEAGMIFVLIFWKAAG